MHAPFLLPPPPHPHHHHHPPNSPLLLLQHYVANTTSIRHDRTDNCIEGTTRWANILWHPRRMWNQSYWLGCKYIYLLNGYPFLLLGTGNGTIRCGPISMVCVCGGGEKFITPVMFRTNTALCFLLILLTEQTLFDSAIMDEPQNNVSSWCTLSGLSLNPLITRPASTLHPFSYNLSQDSLLPPAAPPTGRPKWRVGNCKSNRWYCYLSWSTSAMA